MNPVTPQNGQIIAFLADYAETWCIYEHLITDADTGEDRLIYIGMCQLNEAMGFPDARRNSHWPLIVTDRTMLTHRIVATGSYQACFNHRQGLILRGRPVCNIKGYDTYARATRIRCNETGQIFDNQAIAATATGVNPGALSQHLQGRKGYKKLKGLTFSRLTQELTGP